MARGAAAVCARQNGGAADGHPPFAREVLGDRIADHELCARHRHRRQEFSVRQLRQLFGLAAHSDEVLDVVVPRSDVLVADGPINGDLFARIGLKIQVAPAIALPAPHDGPAAHVPAANPQEGLVRRRGVGVFLVVYEELARPFVQRVAFFLNRLLVGHAPAVFHAPKTQLPDGHMLRVVFFGIDRAARLKNERVQPLLRELFGGPATGDSRADDNRVVLRFRHGYSSPPVAPVTGTQPSKRPGNIWKCSSCSAPICEV